MLSDLITARKGPGCCVRIFNKRQMRRAQRTSLNLNVAEKEDVTMLKLPSQMALIALAFAGNARCDVVADLTPGATATLGDSNFIYTVNWCDGNSLAAGGYLL